MTGERSGSTGRAGLIETMTNYNTPDTTPRAYRQPRPTRSERRMNVALAWFLLFALVVFAGQGIRFLFSL